LPSDTLPASRTSLSALTRAGRACAGAPGGLATEPRTGGLPVGLFGASTGAGAALLVAADRPAAVAAVVSRGGRPDLAGAVLGRVRAPTLLVVGGRDRTVLALNRAALEGLAGRARLEVVAGASHLFPEPGALERVAELAVRLVPGAPGRGARLRAGHLLGPADHRPKRAIARSRYG
jgi:putative phosphoribosyl transferase